MPEGADSREKKFVRNRAPLRRVVERKPIIHYPRRKQDPNYHILYWRETLECGHEQEHGWPDLGIARRRECKKCAKKETQSSSRRKLAHPHAKAA
jgi:hypothetical protein